ncbi:MAG: DUF3883 domain-containing protein [Anaerolineales bacterium]|nr:DUF3883 domain-containing protein [Anaerolineales bacterium]
MGSVLVPCKDAYVSDSETVGLFKPLFPKIAWLEDNPNFKPLRDLCPTFGVSAAISALESISKEDIVNAWKTERLDIKKLFAWFENRRQEIIGYAEVKRKIANLSIFPSSGNLQTLAEVALPGNFDDHLGLAEIVDLAATDGRREFLQDLGMKTLDFKVYAGRLPEALKRPDITIEKRRQVVALLAKRIGEIQDDLAVRTALALAPLIECTDGEFHMAGVCYFDGDAVRDCLGGRAYIAVVPVAQGAAFHRLYEWLGVVVELRISDIVSQVTLFAKSPWSRDIVQAVVSILTHLGKRQINDEISKELRELCSMRWLPAKGKTDRWYSADELYATYQSYLFETQALFLDVPGKIQGMSASLLASLGVKDTPDTILVVKHLLHCATSGMSVHHEVYRFLNDKVDNPAVNQLKGKKCLWWNDSYVAPGDVFWSEHPFGSYRHRLSEELRKYGNFLNHIGVRNAPDFVDAVSVMKEISVSFNKNRTPLNEIDLAVLMACWRLLDGALDQEDCRNEIASLRGIHCVPNVVRLLNPPEWMFFENRAGLADKFGDFLAGNVIPRPLGAARAMSAAGVRSLGAAVQVQLLECEDPIEDVEVASLVRCRRNELGRVLDTQIPGNNVGAVLDRLRDIKFESASILMVRYQLRAFDKMLESYPETAPAIYQPEERRLIVIRRDSIPWSALARELAIALLPEEDPGRIAAGLKEVLIATSAAEAACALDELGYPKMDTTDTQVTGSGDSLVTLGTDEPTADTFVPDTPGVSEGHNATRGMTPDEAISRILGEGAPEPSPAQPGPGVEPIVGGAVTGSKERSGATSNTTTSSKSRPVLRSYVPAPDASGMPPERVDADDEESHTPVDEAGIRKVLEHETICGRIPKEMPHNYPGYDIESRDNSGKVVRYIEVKSMSGQWTDGYAVLSRRQFKKAYTDDVSFWLYVVDRAESDKSHIYRIQNPARRANHFMFDDGWRVVAEEEGEKHPQEIS